MNSPIEATLPKTNKKRIVIIGGGFAGIELIRTLRKSNYEVVVVDKNNYHSFIPLLYQVATAGLSPGDISSPLREFLQNDDFLHFRLAEVNKIIPDQNKIDTSNGLLSYDYVVLATGSKTNFFNNKQIESQSLKLREIKDALQLRNELINSFEEALLTTDEIDNQKRLNVVIVGAGPTGVELAGAIGELKKHVLPKDYPELDFAKMNIYLIEGANRVLPAMSEKSGRRALKYLQKFGINVLLNTMVKNFEDGSVKLSNGENIYSNCLIWAAGVMGNIVTGLDEDSLEKSRYLVDDFNVVQGYSNIYAIGDVANQKSKEFPEGLPMLAPVAIQQAKNIGSNFLKMTKNKPLNAFRYLDKGTMATIGRNKAVVDTPVGIKFGGFLGWFIWMFVHLVSIIGFRRKLLVFANWVWNYVTYSRGNRLIINK